jgi:hypothetical protein
MGTQIENIKPGSICPENRGAMKPTAQDHYKSD